MEQSSFCQITSSLTIQVFMWNCQALNHILVGPTLTLVLLQIIYSTSRVPTAIQVSDVMHTDLLLFGYRMPVWKITSRDWVNMVC